MGKGAQRVSKDGKATWYSYISSILMLLCLSKGLDKDTSVRLCFNIFAQGSEVG